MPNVAGGLTYRSACADAAEDLRCEFISNPQRLYEIEKDWRELWSSLSNATPFQSPDWLLPWWKHYGEGELFSFAFWVNGKLVGLAPMQIFRSPSEPMRKVFLLGTGNSDYMDVVFDPACQSQCSGALISEIRNRSDCWDVCCWQRLRPGSPMLKDIADGVGLRMEVQEEGPCVAIDLHDLGHGAVLLRRSRNYAGRLRRVHPYSVEEASAENLEEFSQALERLHQQRWRAEGCRGVLSCRRDRSFHRAVASRFLNARRLMFYGIRMAGKLIAVIYGFRACDRIYSYLSGFDPEYAQKSVGSITIGHAMQRAIESGYKAFDFLQGQEPYKYTWGAKDLPCFARTIHKA